MLVEVWDEQGPRQYVDLPQPLPTLLTIPSKQRAPQLVPVQDGTVISSDSTNFEACDTFRLFAIRDDVLKMLTPVYVKLQEDGHPCQV